MRGCPAPQDVLVKLNAHGLPDDDEFGVMNCSATDGIVFATIIRRTHASVQRLDPETKELTSAPIEKVAAWPLALKPSREVLELYAGSASTYEHVGAFLSGSLGLQTVVEPIELDIIAAVESLAKTEKKFQVKAAKVSTYCANSFMDGPYAPKYMDTQHGLDFLNEHAEALASVKVWFSAPTGRAKVTISRTAFFSYSCNDDDQQYVQAVLCKLVS
jgi:hypothetical protein